VEMVVSAEANEAQQRRRFLHQQEANACALM
jgi:hypothetical protein